MVTGKSLLPRMSVGYQPACTNKPGFFPCYPMVPRLGFGRLGASNPVIPRYGVAGLGLLTGRITYGLGQQPLDSFGMPVGTSTEPVAPATDFSSAPVAPSGMLSTPVSQWSVAQTPIAQWGAGEILVALGIGYVAWSVLFTTKRAAGRVSEWRRKR